MYIWEGDDSRQVQGRNFVVGVQIYWISLIPIGLECTVNINIVSTLSDN